MQEKLVIGSGTQVKLQSTLDISETTSNNSKLSENDSEPAHYPHSSIASLIDIIDLNCHNCSLCPDSDMILS